VARFKIDSPRSYLIGFSGNGNGRVVLSVNNPDTADHISTYVTPLWASYGTAVVGYTAKSA
jgi:hypothetical protein